MSVTLQLIAEIAREAASQSGEFEVLGVIPEGDLYVEILLRIKDCDIEPCRISLGVLRDMRETHMKDMITEQLHSHVIANRP
jgi:hypothetical protein